MRTQLKHIKIPQPTGLLLTFVLIALITILGPSERTLGSAVRIVYLHGAWVWTGMILFALASIAGLIALILRRRPWFAMTLALGRSGLFYWLTYLPMSLMVMQLSWGGFFFEEPRWQVPFAFGVAGLLLQIGVTLINSNRLTALGNLGFGGLLWWRLSSIGAVLHPSSPLGGPNANRIQIFFAVLLALSLLASVQITSFLYRVSFTPRGVSRSEMPDPEEKDASH
jgi:hypothetical protein